MLKNAPVKKLVIEIRFKPDLSFYTKMDEVAIGFSDELPRWQRSALNIELWSNEKHHRIFLTNKRCFFEADIESLETFQAFDFAYKTFERVCTSFNITEINRVGVRQWAAADLNKTFALMVDELGTRFLSNDETLNSILNDKPTDNTYAVNYETSDGWDYNLRLGPATKEEWFRRVQYERDLFGGEDSDRVITFEKFKSTIPANFLFMDIDCYAEDVAATNLRQQIMAFKQRSHEIMNALIEYCKKG